MNRTEKITLQAKMKTTNFFLALALLVSSFANAQVGIGTIEPHASSILDVVSDTKGFLPPRTTPGAITNAAEGLVIYNEDINCLMVYQNPYWFNLCTGEANPPTGGEFTNGFEANTTCATKVISVTPCSAVSGATINDNTGTSLGIEYNWTGATGFVDGGTTQALVEIGGQCWYSRNAVNIPSAYDPAPAWTNNTDVGWSGNYAGGPFTNEGRLYQWSAAMNDSTTERAQGVCPTDWHVPSDCEWMYLENSLGMSTAHQQATSWRISGSVGSKLSTLTSSGTNSSGFTALLAGYRSTNGTFLSRGTIGYWWSSSKDSATHAQRRRLDNVNAGVSRHSYGKATGFSVRCLKD